MINEKEMVQEISSQTIFSNLFTLAEILVNCLSRACFMYKISQLYMFLQAATPLALKNKFKPIQNDLKYLVGEENSLVCLQPFL